MQMLQTVAVSGLGIVLFVLGVFMMKTGRLPTGVPPGQEDFQKMHATAFSLLHRGLGVFYAAMGVQIQLILLSDLVKLLHL